MSDAPDAHNDRVDRSGHGQPSGVIVAGMHRSATSLVTSILAACGWRTPGPMLAATRTQPRGYFEDLRILRLHEELLQRHGAAWDAAIVLKRLRRAEGFSLAPCEDEVGQVVEFLRGGGAWVWKNPRATLFLADWAQRLPEAQVVICVRTPAAVVDSLLRRKERFGISADAPLARVRRVLRGVSLWHSYNLMAYRFARRHPDGVIVIRVPDDLPALAAATHPPLFEPELFHDRPRRQVALISSLAVSSHLLHWRLRRLGNRERLERLLAGPEPLIERSPDCPTP